MNRKAFPHRVSPHLSLLLAAALVASFAVSLGSVGVGHAAAPVAGDNNDCPSGYICVNTPLDEKKGNDGLCSLREAIIAANTDKKESGKPGECAAGSGADTILLPAGTYFLTRTDNGNEDASQTGDLDIIADLDIVVEGPGGATIDGTGITDRVFHILGGNVTITGVAIKNGGGNVDDGGGIYNGGNQLTLTNVTISGNEADARGGGIYNAGGLTLNNVTVADNTAAVDGGGIMNDGIPVDLRNTIIAGNDSNDCSGAVMSLGHNLDSDDTCSLNGAGDIPGADPLLGPLQNNGGKTETHALLPGSPAIDAGDPLGCHGFYVVDDSQGFPQLTEGILPTDQRGEIRPLDGDADGQAWCDIGAFEFRRTNFVLLRVFPTGDGTTTVVGLLNGTPNTTVNNLYFSHTPSCDDPGAQFGQSVQVTTDENGYFTAVVDGAVPDDPANWTDFFLTATATDLEGNPLGFSNCVSIGENVVWPLALSLDSLFSSPAEIEQYLDQPGQSRWYKFTVEPDSQVIVTLTGLPANYDLTIYKDIGAAYAALEAPPEPQNEDLARLGAEFAADSFSADSFSADSFSADSFSADSFSADSFSADSFSADSFSADSFSADSFSADSFSADSFSADSFSGAQTRSLLGVSAFDGTAGEGLVVNTWNNTGQFYVRVRGRNGASSLVQPFHLEVTLLKGGCGQVSSNLPATSHVADAGDYQTIIVTDLDRMEGTAAEKEGLWNKLHNLAAHPEVAGKVVNVGKNDGLPFLPPGDDRVIAANDQADGHVTCPYAKNLVAQAIKDIVDDYWALNPDLTYVVIVGNDDAVPSFRHPDNALLAPESQYFPPVRDNTASQASLKKDYVLSQDAYGARFNISLNNSTYPVPVLAVGRLVETPGEIIGVIDAYLSLDNGVVAPANALAVGYDFLADAATEIAGQLKAGLNNCANCVDDELIYGRDVAPENGWTADQLRAKLLPDSGAGADVVFLAGHFTANQALAADYVTRLSTQDLIDSDVDLVNSIIFSAGCHAGYNIVNQHDVPFVTREPDWAQAFASKGATLIAGTGYQYGDTDFLEYSERIYAEFSKQLRVGSGPVSIGQALVAAKQVYLARTPVIRGLHEKALLEATIFGLPMLSVDLPGRLPAGGYPRIIDPDDLSAFGSDPGQALGLQYADLSVESPLNEHSVELTDVADPEGPTVNASYLSGNDGTVTSPGEPALPLEVRNVSVDDTVLRGVGFRGGTYQQAPVLPLTGAATTELRGVHTPFLTDYFYPVQMWRVNYFDVLAGGETLLMATPAQHEVNLDATGLEDSALRRQFSEMSFRLYYSYNFETYSGGTQPSTPALAAAPSIIQVSGVPNNGKVTFSARVVANPAAGVQEVWVTYTDTGVLCPAGGGVSCTWRSLNLAQNPAESTLWTGQLDLGTAGIADAANIRYIVQATNGVGLVARADNMGMGFIPGVDTEPTIPTQLEFQSPPTSGAFGTKVTFSAKLTSDGSGLADQLVNFRLGPVSRQARTDANGVATVELSLLAVPGDYQARALFVGTETYIASLDTSDFTVLKQDTMLSLDPSPVSVPPGAADTGIVATLTDANGRALRERSVFFVVKTDGESVYNLHDVTDLFGKVPLGPVPLGTGVYQVNAYFGGDGVDETLELLIGTETVSLDLGDASYNTSAATAMLTINNPPVAVDDNYSVDEDSALAEPAPGVLTNDTDADGQTLTAAVITGPANGELTLNGDGSFTYTPNADYWGPDTFTYTANDGIDDSNLATVTITVNPVNDPPVANDDAFSLDEDTSATFDVVANDTDVDGNLDPSSANTDCEAACSVPSHGTLVNNGDGTFTYTPETDYFGSDSFSYEVCDTDEACDTATVSITVNPVNEPPVAEDDAYSTDEDTELVVEAPGVLGNDNDVDGDPLTAHLLTGPSYGTLTLNVDGSFSYIPNPDFNGTDTFTYKANDGIDDSYLATVTITVNPINDPPKPKDDAYSTGEDTPLSVPAPGVLGNDSDVDDDPLTAHLLTGPSYGTLTLNADGSFIYTPDWDFTGEDSYTYQACDPGMLCDEATVTILVESTSCSEAVPSDKFFWPPDKRFHEVRLLGVTGPEIISIYQDEPIGKSEDGRITGPDTAEVRAEREGSGNGRVYHIQFKADDGLGGCCTGVVLVGIVTHDQSGDLEAIDDGPPWFNSITGEQVP